MTLLKNVGHYLFGNLYNKLNFHYDLEKKCSTGFWG